MSHTPGTTPFTIAARDAPTARSAKGDLLHLVHELEDEALRSGASIVSATLQDQRYFTGRTRDTYHRLSESGAEVRLFARGLQAWLGPGLSGVWLADDDPLVDEWCLVVEGPSPVVFAATDAYVAEPRPESRDFVHVLSRDPAVVAACSAVLSSRWRWFWQAQRA